MNSRSGWLSQWEALGRPFAALPGWAAALVLALLAAALAWSAFLAVSAPEPEALQTRVTAASDVAPASASRAKGDMALYARIAARMAAGEGYYAAALGEQRASNYPTRPFVAVRLPTLAWVQVAIGVDGVRWLAFAIVVGCMGALNIRPVPLASVPERLAASLVLGLGGGAVLSLVAGLDHDFVTGLLLTLALLSYRRERWWPALLAAAAALAIRELAAPFVLLWLAFALAGRHWREAAALAGLLAVFALGLVLHAAEVDAARLPGDLASQGWTALAGYGLPLAALGQLTGLRFLPPELAAPLAILPLVGWAGLGGRLGLFAVLWFAGLATMMALFARSANFYWVELGLPAYAIGLALAPRALFELVRSTIGSISRQT